MDDQGLPYVNQKIPLNLSLGGDYMLTSELSNGASPLSR
jgi:hypothetical protein